MSKRVRIKFKCTSAGGPPVASVQLKSDDIPTTDNTSWIGEGPGLPNNANLTLVVSRQDAIPTFQPGKFYNVTIEPCET